MQAHEPGGFLPPGMVAWCPVQAPFMKRDRHSWRYRILHAPSLRTARRVVVGVIGGTVTLIGVALLVLPGPAFVVLPIGLSILATEFVWARRWLRKARQMVVSHNPLAPPHDP